MDLKKMADAAVDIAKGHWGKLTGAGTAGGLLTLLVIMLIQYFTKEQDRTQDRFISIESRLGKLEKGILSHDHEALVLQIGYVSKALQERKADYVTLELKTDTVLGELQAFKEHMSRALATLETEVRQLGKENDGRGH